MNGIHLASCALAATLAACATAGPRWVPADDPYTPSSGRYTVQLPRGWMRLQHEEHVVSSRDGIFLQRIDVALEGTGKPIGPTKKVVAKGMLPQEVAEVVQDAIASSPGMQGMTVLENSPASLDGRPGFKLVVGYKDRDGLKMRAVVYGALAGESLYQLTYRAPARYYFDRDLQTFEQVRSTFKIASGVPAPSPSKAN
jgi:hypothetical protein